jgi:drug/metabolite transporter (DMT)-like permease
MKILKIQGELYAILSGLMYGLVGYFGSKISVEIGIGAMTFWRCLSSALVALIMLILWSRNYQFTFREFLISFFSGFLFYGPSSIIYFYSSQHIGTGIAMTIFFIYPAFVILLNRFIYGIKASKNYYYAILIIFIGMVLLSDITEHNLEITGISLGVISAFCYAFYMIASSKVTHMDTIFATVIISLGCAAAGLVEALLNEGITIPQTYDLWKNIFLIASICTAFPVILLQHSMKYISATKASILSITEPIFVVIFGVILLGEKIHNIQIIGIIIVLYGAIVSLLTKSETMKR